MQYFPYYPDREAQRRRNVETVLAHQALKGPDRADRWKFYCADGMNCLKFTRYDEVLESVGLEALRRHAEMSAKGSTEFFMYNHTLLLTEDPDHILVETEGRCILDAAGTYRNHYLHDYHMEDGKIKAYAEVMNPIIEIKDQIDPAVNLALGPTEIMEPIHFLPPAELTFRGRDDGSRERLVNAYLDAWERDIPGLPGRFTRDGVLGSGYRADCTQLKVRGEDNLAAFSKFLAESFSGLTFPDRVLLHSANPDYMVVSSRAVGRWRVDGETYPIDMPVYHSFLTGGDKIRVHLVYYSPATAFRLRGIDFKLPAPVFPD